MKNNSNSGPHFFDTSVKITKNLALGISAFSLFTSILLAEPADNEAVGRAARRIGRWAPDF